ncbi:cytosolic endo-beta-N-acetylglucosaminidase 1-like [Malania oleifera]|uniref:cytosolic endo-beta-N-acetylglucosaminidase 1-like n=1 Tax=Malania oleifera TaxID=397392 RepID=UPI0025AE7CD9|nr:cytosolic endo-beta-N-acetylglucosaminidase 1-like [Malania oleifera]
MLRAYLNRRSLAPLRRILLSVHRTLASVVAVVAMDHTAQDRSSDDTPPFNPLEPAPPVAFPVKTLEDLESRSYFESFHFPFNKATVPLAPGAKLPERGRILVCHDMAGGYLDDKWVQGGSNEEAYAIWHWYLIDVFVYFSHNLVTLPPPGWTNAAHKHGVKVLGTFITEGDKGTTVCDKLLSTKRSAQMYAERLTELAVSLGFDGWLLNMEVELDVAQIPNLKEFVSHLTQTMHSAIPRSLVIWYDAVTIDGELIWQNELNEDNKPFFDICDGIFTNYAWEEDYPKRSAAVAGSRKFDVYMGIDVFGRNTYGDGQWNTNVALDVLKKDNVSAAIFAPGWVYETKQPPNFQTAQNRWWSLVEKSWGLVQNYPKALPFYSNFDQGHGYHFSIGGEQVSKATWCNLSCQGFQPFLKFSGDSTTDTIQVLVDFKEASYSGGGNITFKGNLEGRTHFMARLFQGDLLVGESPIHFVYSVKTKWSSMLGLVLDFSSTSKERQSVFLASWGSALPTMNQFASRFSKVIMPHRVTKLEASSGWVIQESSIAMKGFTLTEIHAICYKLRHTIVDGSEDLSAQNSPNYYALLGHMTIKTPDQNFDYPPATAWLVEHQYVKWTSGSQGSKSLSVKITWKLKDGNDSTFPQYNIYMQKLAKQVAEHPSGKLEGGARIFLGTACLRAFYVSNFPVPTGISTLKFTIQVCSVDGACQNLDDSPSFLLDVEG